MSVVAIVLDEANIDEMRGWSASIAQSLGEGLKIFCVQNNDNSFEFEIIMLNILIWSKKRAQLNLRLQSN